MTRLGRFLFLMLTAAACWSCAGNEGAKEPVAGDAAAPAVPDTPGEAGKEAAKPAEAAAPEKSQPNADAAKGARAATTKDSGEMVVNISFLNVRKGPGMSHETVRTVKQGDKVTATSCKAGWCQIGESEFVAKKFLADP